MSPEHHLPGGDVPFYINQDDRLLKDLLQQRATEGTVHLICDANTHALCLSRIPYLGDVIHAPIVIPAGETYKSMDTCMRVWHALIAQGADRHSTIINLGGGMVTDLGGFCAATYMRGLRFIHIPTTLLAMCDAAYGGKLGVDFNGLKNYIGVFGQPECIWVNTHFLETLDERQLRNGMAEIIKHALIGDVDLFNFLSTRSLEDLQSWGQIVGRAIAVKQQFVQDDFREKGKRAALNFGHTIGHAIESACLTTMYPLLHGECVALGMIAESWIACHVLGSPDRTTCIEIADVVRRWIPVSFSDRIRVEDILRYLFMDKKRQHGSPKFSLIREIGHPVTNVQIDIAMVEELLQVQEIAAVMPWHTP